tara:strand:+ start:3304 stop:4263 length:960 start_codon:yes stop_codon:yes gene_type:complete
MGINIKKRVAFIGAGYMSNEHIKVFKSLKKKFLIKGIYNRTKSKALTLSKKYKIPYVAKTIEDLYKTTSADLVVVSINETKVYENLHIILNFPWKIMIEKPVGYNLKNALKISSLVKRKKRLKDIKVALNRRNYPSTLQAIEEIEAIKSKRIVNIFDQQNIYDPALRKKSSMIRNNLMYCNSIHLIDYFDIFCRGKLIRVKNFLKTKKNKAGLVLSHLKYSSGDIGIYNCVWNKPSPWSVSVTTNKKYLELKPLEFLSVRKNFSKKIKKLNIQKQEPKNLKIGLTNQALELYKFLLNKKNNLVSLNNSLNTMKIIKKIY